GIPHLFVVGDKLYHLWRSGDNSFGQSPVATGGADVVATTVAADVSRLENRLHVLYGVGNNTAPCQAGTSAFHHEFANLAASPLSWTASNALGTSLTRPFFATKSTDLTIAGDTIYGAFNGSYQYIVSGVPPVCHTPTILTRMHIKPDGSGNGYTYNISNYYSQITYARTRVTVGPTLAAHSAIFDSNNFVTERITAATNANFGSSSALAGSQSSAVTPGIALDSKDSLHYAFVDDTTRKLYWAVWPKNAATPPAIPPVMPPLVSNIPSGCTGHIARAPLDIVVDDTDRPHIVYVCTTGTNAGTWIARRDTSPTPTWVHTKIGAAMASHVRMRFHRGRLHIIESFPTSTTNAAYRCVPVP
ncbi:MAG: hypothetical protein KAI47_20915, partial [Deltaproteobacteria bacterium]|nr:hypothetical protein [Deltaproteobacteria bacterium]